MSSSRDHALSEMHASWDELMAVVERIPRDRMEEPNAIGEWSIKDLLAHMPSFERWVANSIFADMEGREATNQELYGRDDAPSAEDDLNDDTSNAWVVAYARTQSLEWVLNELAWGHNRLVEAVEACTDADLDDPSLFPSMNGKSFAAILPGQCWSHHRDHLVQIQAWLQTENG
jgi:uncharacterized protein (TIGR03083 family)